MIVEGQVLDSKQTTGPSGRDSLNAVKAAPSKGYGPTRCWWSVDDPDADQKPDQAQLCCDP